MNASDLVKSSILAVTADAFRANGISSLPVTEEEFVRMLKKHDWNWDKAEDRVDWIRGLENEQNLDKIAESSPVLRELFDKYESEALKNAPTR